MDRLEKKRSKEKGKIVLLATHPELSHFNPG
jgi:hypothetical protein